MFSDYKIKIAQLILIQRAAAGLMEPYSICQNNVPFTPKRDFDIFLKGHIKPSLVMCPPD